MSQKYTDIIVTVKDGIGTIKFNRPKQLNSFGGSLIADTVDALRELDEHPDTTFTVITGEGRFFATGADVNGMFSPPSELLQLASKLRAFGDGYPNRSCIDISRAILGIADKNHNFKNDGEKKIFWAQSLAVGMELVRSLMDHKKVVVLAMNGPGVGAGAAWFQGSSDLFYAADDAWLQVTFSQLGLVPENGAAYNWQNSMGTHRANDLLLFGGKATVQELEKVGFVNKIFPKEGFHEAVHAYLKGMLAERDGKSMMEMKRLANAPLREKRIVALFDSWQALAERFVDGEPMKRMSAKMEELAAKRKNRSAKI